jgi:hypothetical protein
MDGAGALTISAWARVERLVDQVSIAAAVPEKSS